VCAAATARVMLCGLRGLRSAVCCADVHMAAWCADVHMAAWCADVHMAAWCGAPVYIVLAVGKRARGPPTCRLFAVLCLNEAWATVYVRLCCTYTLLLLRGEGRVVVCVAFVTRETFLSCVMSQQSCDEA
jgi:hypothetical protein